MTKILQHLLAKEEGVPAIFTATYAETVMLSGDFYGALTFPMRQMVRHWIMCLHKESPLSF
ncbi:MAG: hypothetical protein COB94_001120 [Gammaproteobacteria bacterium]|nr:hypothetical protein [Gammaproteobacteria bacterium]